MAILQTSKLTTFFDQFFSSAPYRRKALKKFRHMAFQGYRFVLRTIKGIFIKIPFQYGKTLRFLLKTRGLRGFYNFFFVKLFARGERVGLQLLDPIEMMFPWLTPYPYMIEIEVTTRCHLRCTICEHTYWPDEEYKKLDTTFDQFKYIIDQFPRLKYINLTGEGSSFANKDFIKILEYCDKRHIYTTVIDSLTALSSEQLESLVKYGVGKFVLSCDGATKEVYEKIRVGGKFEKVLENVRNLGELRKKYKSPLPEFCFRFIFFKDNYQDLIKYPDLVNEYRMKHYVDGDDNHVEMTALLEFKDIKDWVYEPDQQLIDDVNKKLDHHKLPHAWSHPSHEVDKKRPMRECVAWAEPYIMMGGYVLPCCSVLMSNDRDFLIKNSFGNVFEKDFKEIWNSKRYKEFRKTIPRYSGAVPKYCSGCRGFDTSTREQEYGVSDWL